jgi:hypothetical protein
MDLCTSAQPSGAYSGASCGIASGGEALLSLCAPFAVRFSALDRFINIDPVKA